VGKKQQGYRSEEETNRFTLTTQSETRISVVNNSVYQTLC
jgi:hypothetical protein